MYFMIVAFISPGKFSKIVFIICTVSLAIFHPHFSIRILSSVFFSIRILSSAFFLSAIRHPSPSSREELGQRVWIECKASCFEDLSTFDRPLFSEFSTMPGGKVFVVGVGMTKVSSKIIFWG